MIYFDNSATTRVAEPVVEIMEKTMREDFGNPSSRHIMGFNAEKYVREAVHTIAGTMKVADKEIICTSGGTESDNMAIFGTVLAGKRRGKHIITTSIEHPAVYSPISYLAEEGYDITVLPVDGQGHISLSQLEEKVRKDTILVSAMYVNNEIGAVEPVADMAKIIHEKNPDTYFHVDAIQAYGKYRICPKRDGIDMLSASAHKFRGPKGVGFLYVDEKVRINPIIYGGGQQAGMRSGTINVPGIAGMGLAAKLCYDNLEKDMAYITKLKDHIIDRIPEIEEAGTSSLWGDKGAPHIVSISVKDVRAEVLLHALEEKGIYVSSGSACSSNHPGISGTLKGIGLPENLLDSTIRVSLCGDNTVKEADEFIEAMKELVPILKKFKRR